MYDAEYMIRKTLLYYSIPVTEADSSFQILACNQSMFRGKDFFRDHEDLWRILKEKSKDQKMPVLYLEKGCWAYAVVKCPQNGRNYVMGPVLLGAVTRREIWAYRNINQYCQNENILSGTDYESFEGSIHVLYFAVHHCQMDEQLFLKENGISKTDWEVNDNDRLMHQIHNSDRSRNYSSYQWEQAWLSLTKQGKKWDDEVEEGEMAKYDVSIIGEMAKSSLKQTEYTCVCMITLLTRAAIEVGVPSMEAYDLSDMYLQKLEQCSTQPEVVALMENANDAFLEDIRKAKKNLGVPNYILNCKDYIAQHRTKNIRVSDLADIVGVSHSYLTKKFKEIEGITIQQYMIKEKVKAAANMIKFSDISLSEIAEYLNFSSQSHMGQYFRKEYGMTPQEYRRKNKIKEFFEN